MSNLDAPTLAAIYAPASLEVGDLAAALALAQATLENATKDQANPLTNSRYADLAQILDLARAALPPHGLSFIQAPFVLDDQTVLVTTLLHTSGQWLRSVTPVNASKTLKGGEVIADLTMQGLGAAITYARRYALAAMLGIGQEDDDGNTASGRTGNAQQAQSKPPAGRSQARNRQQAAPAAEQPPAQDPPAAAEPPVETIRMIRAAQVKSLGALLTRYGLDNKEQARDFIAWAIGNPDLKGAGDLTEEQAHELLTWPDDEWQEQLARYADFLSGGPPDDDPPPPPPPTRQTNRGSARRA